MIRPWPDDGRTLAGVLVVDLSRQLPGPFVTLELQRLGAEVVRLEAPGGDPLRAHAPGWHDRLNAGKESVVCDLKAEPALGRALCRAADVVVEGFRPGVAERLGVGPADLPEEVVYCSIRGFGETGALRARAGHDVNYLGLAGVLDAARPTLPPLPIADLAAGALTAVSRILVGLLGRERTGRGSVHRISMTDEAHRLAVFGRARDGESVVDRALEGGLACYDLYAASASRRSRQPISARTRRNGPSCWGCAEIASRIGNSRPRFGDPTPRRAARRHEAHVGHAQGRSRMAQRVWGPMTCGRRPWPDDRGA